MGRCGARIEAREWLDQGLLRPAEIEANLEDLAFVNRHLGGARAVLAHVRSAFDELGPGARLSLLDVACGGGDLLRTLAREARRQEVSLMGVGVDLNGAVLGYARAASRDFPELSWVRAHALELSFARGSFDVVMCSSFIHHLGPQSAAAFLRQARALARRRLIAADLQRSALARVAFRAIAWLAGLHPATKHDGTVSLRRAYVPEELGDIACSAGLTDWRLYQHPFCRMTLVCGRPEA